MSTDNIGNQINRILNGARNILFLQGELAQLTYGAFDIAAIKVNESEEEEIEISYPIGYRPDKTTINSNRKYKKDELLLRYQYLAFHQLSINGIVQLVTIVEAALSDIVRTIVLKYPKKLSGKRSMPIKDILESSTIDEIYLRATDTLLNDLSYKSPAEYADSIQPILSINLLECPSFHKYIELKATRDIFIHNRGIANDIYLRKAGTHARVKDGEELPCEIQYFLESYEVCIQLTEWLENELHQRWHSSEFEEQQEERKKQIEEQLKSLEAE